MIEDRITRLATVDDLSSLLTIEESCFNVDRISKRQMKYLLTRAKARCWLVSNGSTAVAYCLCFTPILGRPARLYSLAVLPQCRGQGIAAELLNKVAVNLYQAGYRRLRLEVNETNLPALKLYTKLGYKQIAKLPNYYENVNHGVRMQLDLQMAETQRLMQRENK